jgi:error-prone DNA polymerase
LRVHHAPEFLCSLLNEQPMGFYPPDALVHEAQRRGIEVLGADVNRSGAECRVERTSGGGDSRLGVRIGVGYVDGLREIDARAVVEERDRAGAYRDLAELASRSGIGRDALERLAWASACDSLADGQIAAAPARREALWQLGVAAAGGRSGSGTQLALPLDVPAPPSLREQTPWERVVADYASTGMTLGVHPMTLMREEVTDTVLTSEGLERHPDGGRVEVAGIVVARQRPGTARGMTFILLEDEWGWINLVVPPPVYERHRSEVRGAPFLLARGTLERREGVTNVLVTRLAALSRPELPGAEVRQIEPPPGRETGRDEGAERRRMSDLGAVLPAAHSFGRRGR